MIWVHFHTILLLALFWVNASGETFSEGEARKVHLLNRKQALELEIQLIQKHPETYYILIDLPAGEIYLKSGAHLLRTCQIHGLSANVPHHVTVLQLSTRIDPVTPEPGNRGLRNRGRHLPLDFLERLTGGPRKTSSLYFIPSFLLHPEDIPAYPQVGRALLDGSDIKALGSALRQGSPAILIPQVSQHIGGHP